MDDLPVGFTMALAKNELALCRFAGLDDGARAQVIARARQASSQEEMQAIVQSFT